MASPLQLISPGALVRSSVAKSAARALAPVAALSEELLSEELRSEALRQGEPLLDALHRPLHDLRLSVTDRCNLRCTYCMPKEVYGPDYPFLPRSELLSFEELRDVAATFVQLGVRKLRLTGGEPLLRAQLPKLVALLKPLEAELALTTNGILLEKHAAALRAAGLDRVTVSLDALDAAPFAAMSGTTGASPKLVLAGIDAGLAAGLAVKVNTVVRRGVNEDQVLPLVRHFRKSGIPLRFIEYMDVGSTNGWSTRDVVPSSELEQRVASVFPVQALAPAYTGEVSRNFAYADGRGEVGFISSVTQPFCGDCTRARVSAKGTFYTCLFGTSGVDLRPALREGGEAALRSLVTSTWQRRGDRYSELRGSVAATGHAKVEMSYIGG